MHRVKPWQALLSGAKLPAVMRSKQEGTIPAGSIVIWDTFGELGQLYQLADAVFVGGSLAPLGGQNFLEPLALGRIPCCGPHLDNFAWTLEPSGEAKRTPSKPSAFSKPGKTPRPSQHCCNSSYLTDAA